MKPYVRVEVTVAGGRHCVSPLGTLGQDVTGGKGGHSGVSVTVVGGFGRGVGQVDGGGQSPVILNSSQQGRSVQDEKEKGCIK